MKMVSGSYCAWFPHCPIRGSLSQGRHFAWRKETDLALFFSSYILCCGPEEHHEQIKVNTKAESGFGIEARAF